MWITVKKIDVSRTAKEIIGEEGYWMPQTVRKEKLLSVWRIQAAVQGFFTVKQSIRENILGCAWKLPSVSLKLYGTVNWIGNVLPVPDFFRVTASKTVPAGNYQYRLTGLEEFQFMGCRACSQKQRCQKKR